MSQSKFEALKAKLSSQNQLWEDVDFPAADESLTPKLLENYGKNNIVWMRPTVSLVMFNLVYVQ